MSIEESNKLIGEFMGAKYVFVEDGCECMDFSTDGVLNNRVRIENLKYHKSWDKLMPVWKKAAEILWDIRGDLNDDKYIEAHRITKAFITACQKVEIKAAYTSVIAAIEFIQWYNTQNTSTT